MIDDYSYRDAVWERYHDPAERTAELFDLYPDAFERFAETHRCYSYRMTAEAARRLADEMDRRGFKTLGEMMAADHAEGDPTPSPWPLHGVEGGA
jgi:hypothetical protein